MKTRPSKGDETRAKILAAALEAFRERGFEETTMREVAARAKMAVGAAYYYFPSKDAIVLAFYRQAQQDMEPLLESALAETRKLEDRLRRIMEIKLQYFEPSRSFLGALSAHTDPSHPVSPFSAETREIREQDIAFFERALAGVTRVPKDLAPHLPRLLWMYQMGVILFWIYDRSPDQRKTRALIEQSLRMIAGLIKVSSLPLMQPARKAVLELVKTVTE